MNKDLGNIDLQETWKKMSKHKFETKNLKKEEIMNAIKAKSKFTIAELKKGLKTKTTFSAIFIAMFVWLAIKDQADNLAFWFYITMAVLYTAGSIFLYSRYRKMTSDKSTTHSLLEHLKSNKAAIKSALVVERVWGLCAIGFVLAFYFFKWANEDIHPKAVVLKISIFLVIVIILGCLAELANRRKFGNKIKEIEENIIRLEMLS